MSSLNGKVERSHRLDQQEFYELLSCKDDVDLEAKLDEREQSTTSTDPVARSTDRRLTKRSGNVYEDKRTVSPQLVGFTLAASSPQGWFKSEPPSQRN